MASKTPGQAGFSARHHDDLIRISGIRHLASGIWHLSG